jgi:hypothetical protein
MQRSSGPRKTANLSESLHQQLNMYAIAAGAAGVGVLALALPAEARIVYTAAHRDLPLNKTFYLDLDHNGTNDFKFLLHSFASTQEPIWSNSLKVEGSRPGNEVWSFVSSRFRSACAAALSKGTRVGPKRPFGQGYRVMFFDGSSFTGYASACPWRGVSTEAYLGFRFSIKGQVHFGWARFGNIHYTVGHPSATLTGYAYETIANKPIITGKTKGPDEDNGIKPANATALTVPPSEPVMLGLLALGAPGLSIWRREESVGAARWMRDAGWRKFVEGHGFSRAAKPQIWVRPRREPSLSVILILDDEEIVRWPDSRFICSRGVFIDESSGLPTHYLLRQ